MTCGTYPSVIAGKYKVEHIANKNNNYSKVIEIETPKIIFNSQNLYPCLDANQNALKDVDRLLEESFFAEQHKKKSEWSEILPIYLTSPVDNLKPIS